MTAPDASISPLVCVSDAIPGEQRAAHLALADELFRKHALGRTELPDGYGFRFGPEAFQKLAGFVANERRCCPAISFSIVTTPEGGPVWLYMRGPEGIHEFIKTELRLP